MTKFASGAMLFASLERPNSAATLLRIHGTPKDGKSVGMTAFILADAALALLLA